MQAAAGVAVAAAAAARLGRWPAWSKRWGRGHEVGPGLTVWVGAGAPSSLDLQLCVRMCVHKCACECVCVCACVCVWQLVP